MLSLWDRCVLVKHGRNLQRCGGDGTGVKWLGRKFALVWRGLVRFGHIRCGSLGHERFCLVRFGWAVKVGKVAMRNGEVRSGEAESARTVYERHGVVR